MPCLLVVFLVRGLFLVYKEVAAIYDEVANNNGLQEEGFEIRYI